MRKVLLLNQLQTSRGAPTLLHIAGFFMPVLPYPGMALGSEMDAPRSL